MQYESFQEIPLLQACLFDSNLSLLPSDPSDQLPHEVLPHLGRRHNPFHIQPSPLRQEQTAAGTENVAFDGILILCLYVVCAIHVCVYMSHNNSIITSYIPLP